MQLTTCSIDTLTTSFLTFLVSWTALWCCLFSRSVAIDLLGLFVNRVRVGDSVGAWSETVFGISFPLLLQCDTEYWVLWRVQTIAVTAWIDYSQFHQQHLRQLKIAVGYLRTHKPYFQGYLLGHHFQCWVPSVSEPWKASVRLPFLPLQFVLGADGSHF